MSVVAFDLSLTATGWAVWYPDGTFDVGRFGSTDASLPLGRRVDDHLHEVSKLVGLNLGVELVVVEDLPRNVKHGGPMLGCVHGPTRHLLWVWGHPTLLLTPAALKKYATGKGNAGKELMLVEAVKRLGYDGHDNNEADALWLAAAGAARLGWCSAPTVPKAQLAALDTAREERA